MYTVGIKRDFIAQHYLVGADFGAENQPHSHHYILDIELTGQTLNQHGFLIDIVAIEEYADTMIGKYGDVLLNEQIEFKGLNPSLEHFARIICLDLVNHIRDLDATKLSSIQIKLWENERAWASYRADI